jgi:hypothetical protein
LWSDVEQSGLSAVNQAEVMISYAVQWLDQTAGALTDESLRQHIQELLVALVRLARIDR